MATVNIYDMTDTWNDGGTVFTAIKMNVTDTASAAGSLLLDLQVGGSSLFSVDDEGYTYFEDGLTNFPSIARSASPQTGIGFQAGSINFIWDGSRIAVINDDLMRFTNNAVLEWSSTSSVSSTPDTRLYRDAAATLALRDSTNAQTFNVYNTFTDASNYERLSLTGAAVTVQTAGTGTDNIDLDLVAAGTGEIRMSGGFGGAELSADPSNPSEGEHVIWQSDGTGTGNDGDILVKTTAGAVTKTHILNKTPQSIQVRCVAKATNVATGTDVFGDIVVPYDGTISSIHAYVDTAGTTGLTTIDVNKNGTPVLTTNKVTIDSGETSSETAATAPNITTTSLSEGDILSIDVDGVSTTAPKGLVVVIKYLADSYF